jgi:hypothetical protein
MELKWLKFGGEWIDDLNLRLGPTRGKQSISRWKGQGEGCGYSELQGGSPRLCQLRTVCSGTLREHLIMY